MSIRHSSGCSTCPRRGVPRVELDRRHLHRPHDVGGMLHAQLVGGAVPAREVHPHRLAPSPGAPRGQPLLVHLLAGHPGREAVQHARPVPQRAHDAVADRDVVAARGRAWSRRGRGSRPGPGWRSGPCGRRPPARPQPRIRATGSAPPGVALVRSRGRRSRATMTRAMTISQMSWVWLWYGPGMNAISRRMVTHPGDDRALGEAAVPAPLGRRLVVRMSPRAASTLSRFLATPSSWSCSSRPHRRTTTGRG